jgi:hypothetical protein
MNELTMADLIWNRACRNEVAGLPTRRSLILAHKKFRSLRGPFEKICRNILLALPQIPAADSCDLLAFSR